MFANFLLDSKDLCLRQRNTENRHEIRRITIRITSDAVKPMSDIQIMSLSSRVSESNGSVSFCRVKDKSPAETTCMILFKPT